MYYVQMMESRIINIKENDILEYFLQAKINLAYYTFFISITFISIPSLILLKN